MTGGALLLLLAAVPVSNRGISGEPPTLAPTSEISEPPAREKKLTMEETVRLQVFLDRAEFAPGKIDGRYGEFTAKALALYRQAHECEPVSDHPALAECEEDSGAPSDLSDLDLASVEPVFVLYTVTEADLQTVGILPESLDEQEKQRWLPYQDAAEAIAEKFHADVDFLAEINPAMRHGLNAGDQLLVPNVIPFDVTAVKNLKPGEDLEPGEPPAAIRVDTESNMLMVFQAGELLAAYPVSVGTGRTESPRGEWRVRGVTRMPSCRYDEAMLTRGERSENFHMLPPGPNNPLGVLWISLNRRGVGLHGTDEPEEVGHVASHGCVRLANWDIVRLARKVCDEVPVLIE